MSPTNMYSSMEVDIDGPFQIEAASPVCVIRYDCGVVEREDDGWFSKDADRIIPRNDFRRMNVLLEERNAPASRPVLRLCAELNVLARDAIRTVVPVLTPTQPPVCLRRTRVQPA